MIYVGETVTWENIQVGHIKVEDISGRCVLIYVKPVQNSLK